VVQELNTEEMMSKKGLFLEVHVIYSAKIAKNHQKWLDKLKYLRKRKNEQRSSEMAGARPSLPARTFIKSCGGKEAMRQGAEKRLK
jgi:hypothetical protein